MAQNSKIEWTTHTANLWHGCTKVHAGCDNCYAETLSKRWGNDVWGNDKPRKEIKSVWEDLRKYQKLAAEAGEIHSVFVGSMMDIFEKSMPLINSKGDTVENKSTGTLRDIFLHDIVPASPNLKFLLLTKRPSNINKYIPEGWLENPPANVMFGTSPVDQDTADNLIPHLLKVKGKRFLSIEPMLDKVVLDSIWIPCNKCNGSMSIPIIENGETVGGEPCPKCLIPYQGVVSGIDWIICGGESGHHKRPFNPEWARQLRDECKSARVPFFMKQMDKIKPIPDDLLIREFPF